MRKVAIVDDDAGFLEFLSEVLRKGGYQVQAFPTSGRFLDALAHAAPDLAVLDLLLPGVSGWELVRLLRSMELTRRMPIIVVSGEYRASDHVVRALGLGADEFLAKPVDGDVFLAKVQVLLRRGAAMASAPPEDERLQAGPLAVDLGARSVRVEGREVRLTALEFDLLVHLLRNRNRVLTRGLLLQQVWKTDPTQETRTVDKRVESVRRKLGRHGRVIETVSGVGYCLRA